LDFGCYESCCCADDGKGWWIFEAGKAGGKGIQAAENEAQRIPL